MSFEFLGFVLVPLYCFLCQRVWVVEGGWGVGGLFHPWLTTLKSGTSVIEGGRIRQTKGGIIIIGCVENAHGFLTDSLY